jgi:hypothetical protein
MSTTQRLEKKPERRLSMKRIWHARYRITNGGIRKSTTTKSRILERDCGRGGHPGKI